MTGALPPSLRPPTIAHALPSDDRALRRDLRAFYLFRLLATSYLFTPILMLFQQGRGLSYLERLVLGGEPVRRRHRAGQSFDFDASHVHRMHHDSGTRAVSIHAYSPPLWRMGSYVVAPDGTLRRRSISYAEELRPVEVIA